MTDLLNFGAFVLFVVVGVLLLVEKIAVRDGLAFGLFGLAALAAAAVWPTVAARRA